MFLCCFVFPSCIILRPQGNFVFAIKGYVIFETLSNQKI